MKKFFLILLMIVLPLQMSWAAASAYCQHEEGQSARHLGHHSHQHQAKAEAKAEQPPAKQAGGQVHSDCHFCHAMGVAALPAISGLATLSPGSLAIAAAPSFYSSHIPDGPKRPNWRRPA
ncbi:cytochrome c553 [Oxalobacteraceae bacterium GrIS 1.11]